MAIELDLINAGNSTSFSMKNLVVMKVIRDNTAMNCITAVRIKNLLNLAKKVVSFLEGFEKKVKNKPPEKDK
jgi:hypothetical protein